LDFIVLQFRSKETNDNDDDNEIVNLGNIPHKINLRFDCINV
jgi:hypothetical protein